MLHNVNRQEYLLFLLYNYILMQGLICNATSLIHSQAVFQDHVAN